MNCCSRSAEQAFHRISSARASGDANTPDGASRRIPMSSLRARVSDLARVPFAMVSAFSSARTCDGSSTRPAGWRSVVTSSGT